MRQIDILKSQFTISGWILLSIGVLILFSFYKFLEVNLTNDAIESYNGNWNEELRITEEFQESSNDLVSKINEATTSGKLETEEGLESMLPILDIATNLANGYLEKLQENKAVTKKIRDSLLFYFGGEASALKPILSTQLEYYDQEILRTNKAKVSFSFYKETFQVSADFLRQDTYDKKGRSNPSYYVNNFNNVAFLKKYSEKDYLFNDEVEIKKFFPKGYEYLNNSRDYLSTYYSIAKDYAQEDYDSANYKWQALSDKAVDINLDIDNVFAQSEKEDKRSEIETIKIMVKQIGLINKFENRKVLPFFSSKGKFDEDIVQCQLYTFKMATYVDLIKKYPESKDIKGFILEMNKITPRTTEIDDSFNYSVMKLQNNKDNILITCKSQNNNSFEFKFIK